MFFVGMVGALKAAGPVCNKEGKIVDFINAITNVRRKYPVDMAGK